MLKMTDTYSDQRLDKAYHYVLNITQQLSDSKINYNVVSKKSFTDPNYKALFVSISM